MKIAICSDKRGTGRTTVALSLALALGQAEEFKMPVYVLDCDMEKPDCHKFLHGNYGDPQTIYAEKPDFDLKKCIGCGRCARKCRYNAIAMAKGVPLVDNDICRSCGVCAAVCPHDAIKMKPVPIGEILSDLNMQPFSFAWGRLKVGESQSQMVISQLQKLASPEAITLLDCSPGTGCSAAKTIATADRVILVTGPVCFGQNTLQPVLNLCSELHKPCVIFINRSDENDSSIEQLANVYSVPVAGKIPFISEYASACGNGLILAAEFPALHDEFISCFLRTNDAARVPVYQNDINPAFSDCDDSTSRPQTGSGNFQQNQLPKIEPFRCIKCGKCLAECRFNAISRNPENGAFQIEKAQCEGCGLCVELCPARAIKEKSA